MELREAVLGVRRKDGCGMGREDDAVDLLLENPKKYVEKRERELASVGYTRPSEDSSQRDSTRYSAD